MSTVNRTEEVVEVIKKKAIKAGDIAIEAAMHQMADESAVTLSVGVGLFNGLKRTGDLKTGVKAGLTTYGLIGGLNAIYNVARRWDEIKKA